MLAVSLGWAAVAAVVLLLRQTGVPATDTIWAEDGQVFLGQALDRGPLEVLFRPAEGYLSLAPRVVGGLVSLAPLELSAALLAVGAAVVLGLLSVYTLLASASILRTRWARAVLAALVVLLPALARESMNNVTNLQWSLILPAFVGLLSSPRRSSTSVAGSAVAFVAGAAVPATAACLPIAAARLGRNRGRGSGAAISWSFIAGAAVQSAVLLVAREGPRGLETSLGDLPGLYSLRVGASFFMGEWLVPWGWRTLGWGLAWTGLVIGFALLGYGAVRFPERRGACILATATSVAAFSLPVFLRGTSLLLPPPELHLHGSRWVIGPSLLLALASLIVLEERHPGAGRWPWIGVRTAVLASILAAVAVGFRTENVRSKGPRWSEGVDAARARCEGTVDTVVPVPISPRGWSVRLPCDRL